MTDVWYKASCILPMARLWRRLTTNRFDEEIQQTAAACLLDLRNAGVLNLDVMDPLIQQAVKFYLKSHFGDDNDSEKWDKAYEHLKRALSLSGDYTKEETGCGQM